MMDNKLSELSKLVAYLVVRKNGVKEIGDPRQIVDGEKYNPLSDDYWCPGGKEKHSVTNLYSQECVSALLAELEDERASRAQWQQNCTRAEERIAELERANTSQDDHINQQQDRIESLEKTNTGLGQRLGAAEKRLATPVRLVAYRNSPDMHTKQYYEAIGFNQGIDACSVALRAAGFTVEGDSE